MTYPEVTYIEFECACDDDIVATFRDAWESGELPRQLEEIATMEAMEAVAH